MFYSEDFKKRVKNQFPDWRLMNQALDNNDVAVGRYLSIFAGDTFNLDEILKATSLEKLQEDAKSMKEATALYKEWCGLFNEQNILL